MPNTANGAKGRGPLGHRITIAVLSSLLSILLIWALGFVIEDIGNLTPPDWMEFEAAHVDQALVDEVAALEEQSDEIARQINARREIQATLEVSLNNSRETMEMLADLHRLSLEGGVTPTEAERDAMAESENLYMENQRRFQSANVEIDTLAEQRRTLTARVRHIGEEIDEQRTPAREEYQDAMRSHRIRIASIKLAVLVPLLFIAAVTLLRFRGRAPAPICWAIFVAVFWRVVLVMHQHFPREFFRYIAVGASIVIVLVFLIHITRAGIARRGNWSLRQRRDAYRRCLCPSCGFPILQGVGAHSGRPSKAALKMILEQREIPDEPYSCPSCGEALYEKCGECDANRHSLLPHCASCGAEKPAPDTTPS